MSLPLKVLISQTGLTKTMLFAPNMSVGEACKGIREKISEEGGGADHGLFQPAHEGKRAARWFRQDRTLAYYELQPNDTVEYKKKHRAIKVKLPDETQKTFLVDDTLSVSGIVAVIGDKMGITNAEEFSLKVDGKDKWLTQTQTLREQGVPDDGILLLKKKYHVGPVSIEDPITLHLVYVESRDAILSGNHPCREDEAMMFAALQMQIQQGNYDPNKSRTIDIKTYLPPAFHKKQKKAEEKIVKEYKKLVGMNEANAKYRYVQLCRSLKTFGITFFEVKKKDKSQSKPKKFYLGITRDTVSFMDYETKEIIKEFQLNQLRRWAAAPTTMTLDFGDWADEYSILITEEGEAISSLIAGYIDILLKKRNESGVVQEDGNGNVASEEPIAPIRAQALTSTTMSTVTGVDKFASQQYGVTGGAQQYTKGPSVPGGQKAVPTSLQSAQNFVQNLLNEMGQKGQPVVRNTSLTPGQWRKQVISNSDAVMSSYAKMAGVIPPNQLDKGLFDQRAAEIAMNLAQLVSAARNAAVGPDGEEDIDLLAGAKKVADAVKQMLDAAKDLSEKPNDPGAMDKFVQAQRLLAAATAYIQSASKGTLSDAASQKLLIESVKNVADATRDLLANAKNKGDQSEDVKVKGKIHSAAADAAKASDTLSSEVSVLAPAILNDSVRKQIENSALALEGAASLLQQVANWDDEDDPNLGLAAKRLSDAISQLLATTRIAESEQHGPDLAPAAQEILDETAKLLAATTAEQINAITKNILTASTKLVTAAKASAAQISDEDERNRLLSSAKGVAEATRRLVQAANNSASDPGNKEARKTLHDAAQRLTEATQALAGNSGEKAALHNLRSVAKVAAAATTVLISNAKQSSGTCSDAVSTDNLKNASRIAGDAIGKLIRTLDYAWQNPNDKTAQDALVRETSECSPQAYKLVAASKGALSKITDPTNKQLLRQAADDAAEALQRLVSANKSVVSAVGQQDITDALDKFSSEEASLDSALMDLDSGGLRSAGSQTSEGAMQLLTMATKEVANSVKKMVMAARTNPDEFGPSARGLADAIGQANVAAITVASVISDKKVQQDVLQAAKVLTREAKTALGSARAVSSNPSDPNLNKLLSEGAKGLADALTNLLTAARGAQASATACDEAIRAITAAAAKLAPKKGNLKDFPNYSQELENNIKGVQAAVASLVNTTRNNPMGVGSAAKTVASSVNPLVASANAAAGSCSDADTQKDILGHTKDSTDTLAQLLSVVKLVATKDDPSLKDDLGRSAEGVSESLDKLLSALNSASPGQEGLDEALKLIAEANARLQKPVSPQVAQSTDIGSQMEELKRSTARLGEAVKSIISASRNAPDKMGGIAKDAASSVANIIDSTRLLAATTGKTSVFAEDVQKVKDASNQLLNSCLAKDPAVRKGIVNNAKEVTLAAQQLGNIVKEATEDLDPKASQPLTEGTRAIAALTSQLVQNAKGSAQGQPGAPEQLQTTHRQLVSKLDDLLRTESGKTTTPKADKLVTIARDTANSTTAMLEASKAVLKRPNESENTTQLTGAGRQVGNAIKNLLDAAKSMGEIDLDDVIDRISQVIIDLDSAAISATVGLLENTAPPGTTSQALEEELVEVTRELANSIKNLVTAQKESPTALARAAKLTAAPVPRVAELARQLAGSMSDAEKQQKHLNSAKGIADAVLLLMQACKQNDPKDISAQAKNASGAIGNLLNSMKGGVLALRTCDEASKTILEELQKLDLPPTYSNRGYSDLQRELNNNARELVGGIAKLVTASKNPQDVGENSKGVANTIGKFVDATHAALSAINEPNAQKNLLQGAKGVVNSTNKIVQNAKYVASDPKNSTNQQKLSASYKEVTDSVSAFIAAVKQGATEELKCEAAIDSITRSIAELDAAALYAATGQLKPESDDVDVEAVQNDLLAGCKSLAEEIQNVVAAAAEHELGNAAQDTAQMFDKVTRDTKQIASLMNNLLNQQEILMGAKSVGNSVQGLVGGAMKVQEAPENGENRKKLVAVSQKVATSIRELVALAQSASAAASSGIRELEVARKLILQTLEDYKTLPPSSAGAVEVLKAAKGIADGVSVIMANCSSFDDAGKLGQGADSTGNSARDLLICAKAAQRLTDDSHGKKIVEAVKGALQSTAGFLDTAKTNRRQQTSDSQKQLSEASDEVVRMIGEVVEASKVLPGSEEALKLFQETDELEQLAEKELMNAADTIALAAKTLLEAKQRQLEMRKNKDSPLPEEEITEAILDAARAIATATATLVSAATAAQKELVAKGQISKQQSVYRRDPAWAKGLISAAQSVAGTVKDLVTAANSAAQGKAEEEALVASAKGVAAATARLVFASRTKADPFSPTQKKLSSAAKSVAEATQRLVEAAKSTTDVVEERDSTPDWEASSQTEKRRAEVEAQVKILKLQKELEKERVRLGELRKNEYKDSNPNAAREQAAPAPASSANQRRGTVGKSPSGGGTPVSNTGANAPAKMTKSPSGTPAAAAAPEKFHPVEHLQQRPVPLGLDATKLEQYLTDEDFAKVFGMDRQKFSSLPGFRQSSEKQKRGLL